MLRVLVPSRTPALLEKLLNSMEKSEEHSSAYVIVGDNGLGDGFREQWRMPRYTSITAKPFVYAAAINQCAGAAGRNDDFLILGDDTEILTLSWRSCCEMLLEHWPEDYGLINLSEIARDAGVYPSETSFAFVGTLIPRSIWETLGPMDERFTGYGHDDTDYCLRALHAGYRLGITDTARIRHAGSGTYKQSKQRAVMYEQNRAALIAKWGMQAPPSPEREFLEAAPHFNRGECGCASISA